MLGFYDYTVWLTYASLLSAGAGILFSLHGTGHPYVGIFFLMISGLCDAFDGRVARSKKNRTRMEMNYGVQIDSLADLVAFGVLPICVGSAMLRVYETIPSVASKLRVNTNGMILNILSLAIMLFFLLAALIRLAYFNVTEEERQQKEGGCRKYYEGLPVTSSAIIFPLILTIQYIQPRDITPIYFLGLLLVGIAFISKFKVPKPGLREILIMVGVGAVDFLILLFFMVLK
ncbi:MAG: CDP-alcohol phosphatidyltransferase family protein [Eubacteriales bacterium]|nr:CDP-alcohol phosphatidyltransferase family protein [Eubacteriales bacterium]